MIIRTPDQRLRVFVSSTLQELAEERAAAREAIDRLRLAPVMFELGARPHPPKELYRSYLDQSHIFVGIYWERYGWVAPDMDISGLEDEYRLSGDRPKLIYVKTPAPNREPRLKELLDRIRNDDRASYKPFSVAAELQQLIENDLAILLTERFEMSRPDAPQSPQPPRASNLPTPSTPLMGRERDVEEITQLLMKGEVRMVTLYGPGGIGKTRLAIEVGRRVQAQFPDGVCFVPLATVTDHNLVVPAIGHALGLGETRAAGLADRVIEVLRARQQLLILDNFEQVMPAASQLGELLAAAPRLEMLVTSRAVLRVRGEYEFAVPTLALPQLDIAHAPLEAWQDCAAVQLFLERARAVKPDFELTRDNAPAVAEICARLDGLPLAIELAASRVKVLTPQAILARLIDSEQQARLLSGGPRDLPERQQTLRNTLDWSHSLLSDEEKQLFARLSTFVGGWTLDAATAICGHDSDELTVLDTLGSLVDKSLITRAAAHGEERFAMLNTIHDYAAQRLEESGQAEDSRRRHAAHYAALAARAGPELKGVNQHRWVLRLNAESGNLQAALSWMIESGDPDSAVGVGWSLLPYWMIASRLSELLRWMVAALSRLDVGPTAEPRRITSRATALALAGLSAAWQGNPDWATFLLSEAEALLGRAELPAVDALVHSSLAITALYDKDFDAAQRHFERGLQRFRDVGDAWGAAMVLSGIQRVAIRRGDFAATEKLFREGQALADALGDGMSSSLARLELGRMHLLRQELELAEARFGESIQVAYSIGYRESIARCMEGLAAISSARGDGDRAGALLGAAHGVREAVGLNLWQVEAASHDELVQAVKAQLGAGFDAAWARGEAMTLDQAVGLALRWP